VLQQVLLSSLLAILHCVHGLKKGIEVGYTLGSGRPAPVTLGLCFHIKTEHEVAVKNILEGEIKYQRRPVKVLSKNI